MAASSAASLPSTAVPLDPTRARPVLGAGASLVLVLALAGCGALPSAWLFWQEPQVPAPAAPLLVIPAVDAPPSPSVRDRPALRGVAFAPGSAAIDAEAALVLDIGADELRERPELRVSVEGHAEAAGADALDPELSAQRAEAVRRFLVRKGVAPDRLVARGVAVAAGAAPVAAGGEPGHDRRVELRLVE
jgi:outer membrane protein OmpA-like peptidoglycan-associated protein